ncbi:MAG: chemotaxis protein CheA [Rhodocyclaceae bacterium]|nr:chemotaxis protein CheA [Rhodocyclaceae bacterium]
MSDFAGMEGLLEDFLREADDHLSEVDSKLAGLERAPDDLDLLDDIFCSFLTIKGGAGLLDAGALVTLCQLTGRLFDRLRSGRLRLDAALLEAVMEATRDARRMLDELAQGRRPRPAPAAVLDALRRAIAGETAPVAVVRRRRADDRPGGSAGRRVEERDRDATIRVDTLRLDQVLNLSGEIGLTKNRLTSLRADILAGRTDAETLHALDQAVSQLDLLVSDLQSSVMKTRMQPIGRLFQKYPRIARDLARQLGKDVELVLAGEETEVDKTMIEDLADPLLHLIRNAVDHGIEPPHERLAAGKPEKGSVRLEARQEGDHIVLIVADDGRGMSAERIRARAVDRGLISEEEASGLDERQSLHLILLPGFSTKTQSTDVSGRGVGMDVVRTKVHGLSGSIDLRSEVGRGSLILISLPLTLAILPVLLVQLGDQPFALPLSLVREILPLTAGKLQKVGGKRTCVVRGEILPVIPLSRLLGRPETGAPQHGVLMQSGECSFILAVDSFAGRDDAVVKPLEDFRPRGVAGVTTLADGRIVLILDINELLGDAGQLSEKRKAA